MAGRILSRANETKLRSALTALGEVLGLLDKEPESTEPAPETEAVQAEAGQAVEAPVALVESGVVDLTEFVPLTNQG